MGSSFIQDTVDTVESAGGRVHFVELVCPKDELERRIESTSRAAFSKIRSRTLFRELQQTVAFAYPQLPDSGLTIDTSQMSPCEAASKNYTFLFPSERGT